MTKALMRWMVRLGLKPIFSRRVPLALHRRLLAIIAASTTLKPSGTTINRISLNGIPTEILQPAKAEAGHAILYLHGGAYVAGSPASHRNLAAQIAHAALADTYVIDYRLAPEYPCPAAVIDAVNAYRGLLGRNLPASQIAIVGDSAGGGLTLATSRAILDAGLPPPAALAVISPWVDLGLSGDSLSDKSDVDPMLSRSWLEFGAHAYRGDLPAHDPRCSPLFADLRHMPPLLIHAGTDEILLSDAERLAQRAQIAGVAVRLHRFEGLWHVFQLHAGLLAESDFAIAEIGEFLREHWQVQVT